MRLDVEVFLNIAWALVALLLIELRRRTESRTGAQRRNSLIALAMLLVILFPVISVSDDLWSVQYAAETDTALRRIHLDARSSHAFPAAAPPPEEFAANVEFSQFHFIVMQPSTPRAKRPWFPAIFNRPPPSA
jgi:hypothetical protein